MATKSKPHIAKSGAKSSEAKLPYHMILLPFWKRLATRFHLGNIKHQRGNWMRAFQGPNHDIPYLRDRYDHAVEHLLKLREGTKQDDHLSAVAWFINFAIQAEELGVDWAKVLEVQTPEQELLLRIPVKRRK